MPPNSYGRETKRRTSPPFSRWYGRFVEENATRQEAGTPIRFHRIGMRSSVPTLTLGSLSAPDASARNPSILIVCVLDSRSFDDLRPGIKRSIQNTRSCVISSGGFDRANSADRIIARGYDNLIGYLLNCGIRHDLRQRGMKIVGNEFDNVRFALAKCFAGIDV